MFDYIENKEWKGVEKFKLIFLFCLAFIIPLIIANVPYMDDNTRLDNGYGYWEIEGRPVTTLLFKILSFNLTTIYNLAPLPLLVGCLFFSYSVFYATNIMGKKKTIVNIIPFLFLICNPFFLQNMSYQYDVIGHLFSISFILLSFFYKNKNLYKEILFSALLILSACGCYQPSTNIFIALFALNIIFKVKSYEDPIKYIRDNIFKYCAGISLYYLCYFIGFTFFFEETSHRNKLINISDLLDSYYYSLDELLNLISGLWKDSIGLLIVISSVMFFCLIFYKVCKEFKKEEVLKEKTFNILLLVLSPLLLFLSIWGPFILLKELFFNPRDFPVIGVFFMIFAFSFNIDNKVFKKINVIFLSSLILSVFSFSYTYGNALNQDYMYKKYVYDSLSIKLEDKSEDIDNKKIIIYGRHAMTSYAGKAFEVHPFLNKLIYPENTNFFKEYNIAARNVYNIQGGVVMDNLEEWSLICKEKIKPMIKDGNYEVFNFKDHISVWFKRTPVFCDNYPTDTSSLFDKKEQILNNKGK